MKATTARSDLPGFRRPLVLGLAACLTGIAPAALPSDSPTPAATITVSNCNDSGTGSLRDALGQAVSGDTIDLTALACSTITLTTGQLLAGADDLAINGPGADTLAIDATGQSRVLRHTGNGTITISGLAIRNGQITGTDVGGCISSNSNVALVDSTIEYCGGEGLSLQGGAVFAGRAVTLTRSTVSHVTVSGVPDVNPSYTVGVSGGAVLAYRAITLTDSTIDDINVSASSPSGSAYVYGGGLRGYGVTMTRSVVSNVTVVVGASQSKAIGGAIQSLGNTQVTDSTIANNSVTTGYPLGFGGGLATGYQSYHVTVITGSTISNNSIGCASSCAANTYLGGGGIGATTPLEIINSTVSGNSVGATNSYGGGVAMSTYAYLRMANATITDNSAATGSGIYDHAQYAPQDFMTDSSIVAGNNGPSSQIVAMHTLVGAHNLITSANVALPPGTLTGDPMLAPLADNGGMTLTHALLPGSPAIDAGSNPESLPTDQRGPPFARVVGPAADIGAYESQTPPPDFIFSDGFDG